MPCVMIEVRPTQEFSAWLHRLRDANTVAPIVARIRPWNTGIPGTPEASAKGSWKCVSTTDLVIASTICLEGRE
jgi:putative component of toxin-antitoxin plasmid stabilization module